MSCSTNILPKPDGKPMQILRSGVVASTPGSQQELINVTVPAGQTWRLQRYRFISRAYAQFTAQIDGDTFESGKTGPSVPDLGDTIPNRVTAGPGAVIKVLFLQTQGPITDTESRLYYTVE